LPFSFSVERRIIAFGVALGLRLQVLLHLQLVHLPEELLEQLAPLRPDALLQLVHDFFRRHRATETGSIGASLPTNDFRHRHHATKERLRIFLG
jgi:hypothetical protein